MTSERGFMKYKAMRQATWFFYLFFACLSPQSLHAKGSMVSGASAFPGAKTAGSRNLAGSRPLDPALLGGFAFSWDPGMPIHAPFNLTPSALFRSASMWQKGLLPESILPGVGRVYIKDSPLPSPVDPGAFQSAKSLAESVSPEGAGKPRSTDQIQKASGAAFDGNNGESNDSGGDSMGTGGGDSSGGNDRAGSGGGDGGGAGSNQNSNGGAPLNQLYPRVIFLQDIFVKPASDKTIEYVEKLLDAGVHLVFLTWRPQKGPGSAEEVLLSRIKQHRTNPIMVVSFNGGKISLHGRAANPKSILEDVGAFGASHIEAFQTMKVKLEKTLKLPDGALAEKGLPSLEGAFSYILELPGKIKDKDLPAKRGKAVRRFNELLRAARLPYKMEPHPESPRAIMVQSMPLRFSLPRVYQALDEQFHGENLLQNSDKFLILADSRKSPKFTSSFPHQSDVQVVGTGGDVEETLGAVLGDRRLSTVSVKLGKLRQYVEYWEPGRRHAPEEEFSGGGGGVRGGSKGDRKTQQQLAMYVGSSFYQLMAWFYEQVWRGQNKFGSREVLQARLKSMWYNPMKYGVYVNKPLAKTLAKLRKTKAGRATLYGYLDYANGWLTNFYDREFGDYSAAAKDVQRNMVGLATDRKSLITLEFVSASTGRLYKIHTRIPRVMKLDTSEGRVLTAYSYRTGKETPDDGEPLLARTLAMALLKGHGRKGPDGKWHHGAPDGPVIGKLRVQLEYRSSHRPWAFDPADFMRIEEGQVIQGPIAQEITSAIERMEADPEYQDYYKEHEEEATKADLAKKKARKGKASKKRSRK